MPVSRIRVNVDEVYLPLAHAVIDLLGDLNTGTEAWNWSYGFRSIAQSNELFDAYKAGRGGKAAPGGKSAHNFGLAADFSRVTGGTYDGAAGEYERQLGPRAEAKGLVWGGRFGDAPHVNWPGFTTAADLAPLLALWRGFPLDMDAPTRLRRIWAQVDSVCRAPAWRAAHPVAARYM